MGGDNLIELLRRFSNKHAVQCSHRLLTHRCPCHRPYVVADMPDDQSCPVFLTETTLFSFSDCSVFYSCDHPHILHKSFPKLHMLRMCTYHLAKSFFSHRWLCFLIIQFLILHFSSYVCHTNQKRSDIVLALSKHVCSLGSLLLKSS